MQTSQRTALKESVSSGYSRPITRNLKRSRAVQLPSKLKPTSRFERFALALVPLRSPTSFRHGTEKSRVPNTLLKVGSINEEVDVVAEGIAKNQLAETPGKPARVRLGGDVQAAKLLNKVIPVYPTTAKSAGIAKPQPALQKP